MGPSTPSLPSGPWLAWANGEHSRRWGEGGEGGQAVTSLLVLGRPSFLFVSLPLLTHLQRLLLLNSLQTAHVFPARTLTDRLLPFFYPIIQPLRGHADFIF